MKTSDNNSNIRTRDQNKIIGNTMYSIVLGFVIYSVFIDTTSMNNFNKLCNKLQSNDLLNLICDLLNLICDNITTVCRIIITILLMIYFIVDWFSFNVLVEIGKRESFRRLFLSISFLVFLGYIIVLTETQLYANTYIFLWFLLIYFLGTIMSYFFGLVFGIAGKNDVIFRIAVKKEGMWVKIDWFVKLFLCIAGTIYLMFFKLNTDTAIVALIGILLLLIVIKCIRLTHLVKKGTHE